jgi:hypothetical protein
MNVVKNTKKFVYKYIYRSGDSDMEWALSTNKRRYSTGIVAICL